MARVAQVLGLVVGLVTIVCSSGPARACHELNICVEWDAQPAPGEEIVGDYGLGETIPAYGVRVALLPPPPEHARDLYIDYTPTLDEDACFRVLSDFTTGFTLVVYAEAKLGQSGNVSLRSFNDSQAHVDDEHFAVAIPLGELSPNATDVVTVPTAGTPALELLSWAAFTVHRVDSQLDPSITGPHTMEIWSNTNEQQSSNFSSVRIPIEEVSKKFLISHEVGHWLLFTQFDPMLGFPGLDSSYMVVDDPCKFMAGLGSSNHGIRSAEYSPLAMLEGFAQFVSTLTYNEIDKQATFKYYKEIDDVYMEYEEFIADGQLVSLEGGDSLDTLGGPSRWVETQCSSDWLNSVGVVEVTSEIDWMRFFWQFLASDAAPAPKPTLWEVFRLVAYTRNVNAWPDTSIWSNFQATVIDPQSQVSQFSTRMNELGVLNGVTH